jgi:hypothetical protein
MATEDQEERPGEMAMGPANHHADVDRARAADSGDSRSVEVFETCALSEAEGLRFLLELTGAR